MKHFSSATLFHLITIIIISHLTKSYEGLDNGLARTPPMGWLNWERFRCNLDCKDDPDNCISENLFKVHADLMARDGYLDAGYEYVNIDDCWMANERTSDGRLQPDKDRFPGGMKALADYVHSKGLKLGLYESFGIITCQKYPGSEFYLQIDAETFAEWEIDSLKLDACGSNADVYALEYPPLAFYLNQTGRHILLTTEYATRQQCNIQWPKLAAQCNLARNHKDVEDGWESILEIINYEGNDTCNQSHYAGPGFFIDPDMLVIGNYGLSYDQEKVQMAMWCIMAAPLFMSVDLRTIRNESRDILQNRRAIAINQDPMGVMGRRILMLHQNDIQVWTKPLATPKGSFAFTIMNTWNKGMPIKVTVPLKSMGFNHPQGYRFTEVFDGVDVGKFKPGDSFVTQVNPTGVFFGKAVPL